MYPPSYQISKLTKEQQTSLDASIAERQKIHNIEMQRTLGDQFSADDFKRFSRIFKLAKDIRNKELIQLLNELAVSVRENYRIDKEITREAGIL